MPLYSYKCNVCGKVEDMFRRFEDRGKEFDCEKKREYNTSENEKVRLGLIGRGGTGEPFVACFFIYNKNMFEWLSDSDKIFHIADEEKFLSDTNLSDEGHTTINKIITPFKDEWRELLRKANLGEEPILRCHGTMIFQPIESMNGGTFRMHDPTEREAQCGRE
jgi:hypothetical protein